MKQAYLLWILLLCFPLLAQEEAVSQISTDRPNATESAITVPAGFLQIETGALRSTFNEGNLIETERTVYNTTLLRYGILDNFEFRLGWNFEEIKTRITDTLHTTISNGFSPLLAGMKVNITKEEGWKPTIGLIGHLFLPFTAGRDFKPETTGVDFRFAFEHSLSKKSSISYNIGAQWAPDNPEAAYIYTFAYGYSLINTLTFYAEVYGDFPENSSANHLWDAGVLLLLKDNIQLDATVGSGITQGQNLLLSAGVSFRIPK